jgi:hypothetical protein
VGSPGVQANDAGSLELATNWFNALTPLFQRADFVIDR